MSSHIQLRSGTYYARLNVPQDLRLYWGKSELIQSLKTADLKIAQARAMSVVGGWKQEFQQLRSGGDSFERQAMEVRIDTDAYRLNKHTGMSDKDYYLEHFADHLPENKGNRFREIAVGKLTPFGVLLEDFIAQWDVEAKTKSMARTAISRVANALSTIEQATFRRVGDLIAEDLTSVSTKRKNYGFVAQYWQYLDDREAIKGGKNPFANRKYKDKSGATTVKRQAFSKEHVVQLHREALNLKDSDLASLILIGAHTGARIEEICSLKVLDLQEIEGILCLKIIDAKTTAGVRTIPAHTHLLPHLLHQSRESNDGYILSGLTFNKYKDRSNAIGKRFGRLKHKLGFGDEYVFHSIRKTVITVFENLGVSEGLTADIVGHEKKTITYGLYSAGHSIANKAAAIERLEYSFTSIY